VVYLQVLMFAIWALEQVLKWTNKGAMPENCRPHFAHLMQLCNDVGRAGGKEGLSPSTMTGPIPVFASEEVTDREGLRRSIAAGDKRLLSGFFSGRFLSDQEKKVLQAGADLIQEDQEPTNGFLDSWLAKFLAM
jgi:hypothetical protein